MYITDRSIIKLLCRCTSCFLLLFSTLPVYSEEVYLCIWRNPERTMTRLFPNAQDYKTVDRVISAVEREHIEARLKSPLLPGQRDRYQYFEMTGTNKEILGYTIAASQKGEFGAIEFIVGLDTHYRIIGIYIQRSRERDNTFKDKPFLDLFTGKAIAEIDSGEKLLEGKNSVGATAVITGLRKELIAFQELVVTQK